MLTRMGLGMGLGMAPVGTAGGGAPPEPTDYELLVEALQAGGGWFWDFTRQDKLWQDNAGTLPVTAAEQAVGRATDLITDAALIQATSANRPAWKQGAGVLFDGSNDGLVGAANFDFSGTDEVMVVAGLRKLSDAATGQVVELSTSNATNDGAFTLWAPGSAAPRLDFASRGTALSTSTFNNALVAAPVNAVLSGQGKISTDTALLRIDGVQRAAPTTDQGSGNYGNYPLYVGRRAGALTPFNGYLTSLCVIPYLDTDLLALAESVAFTLNEGLPT